MKRAGIILGVLFLLVGCSAAGALETVPENAGYCFTDSLDREINVQTPQRVAALMGGLAEIWQLAGGELVGVTDDAFDERNLSLDESVTVLGKYNMFNMEALIALNPDLVLLSTETKAHVAALEGLEAAGIPSAYFNVTHFEDYLKALKICTEITGRADLYREKGEKVKADIETILAAAPENGPEVLLMITHSGGAAVMDHDFMTGRMLTELGCNNLADTYPGRLKEFSMESVLFYDPDYIFIIPMGNDEDLAQRNLVAVIEENPAWNGLSAVKNGNLVLLPKELFLYKPNAGWGESYAYLAKVLYGG